MKTDTTNSLDLRRFLREIKKSWWAYTLCILMFGGLAVFYSYYRMPVYNTRAMVMIDQENDASAGNALGAMSGVARMFSIGGLSGASAANEVMIMESNDVIGATVKELGLNRVYVEHDGLKRKLLYGDNPIKVDAPVEFFDTLQYPFRLEVALKGNKADVEMVAGGRFFPKKIKNFSNLELPTVIHTPYGPLSLMMSDSVAPDSKLREITVNVMGNAHAIDAIEKELEIEVIDKMADGISYFFQDPSKERGRDIVNSLIRQYEIKRINQKHKYSNEQVEFYDARIAELFSELNKQEADIESYKKDHNLVAVEAEAEVLAQSKVENQVLLAQLQAQQTFYQQVLNTLENDPDGMAIIAPSSNGSVVANPLIEQYNTAVLEKRALELSANDNNVALQQQKALVSGMRKSLLQNARLMVDEAKIGIESYNNLENKADRRIAEMPTHERKYVKMARDQTVLSELYLYLISQRETAAMDSHSSSVPGYAVDAAYCDIKPDVTKTIIVAAVCILLALLLPTVFAFWRLKRKDRMKEPFDLAALQLEDHTVVVNEGGAELADMRNAITANADRREIFIADFTDTDAYNRLVDSFIRAGRDPYIADIVDLGFTEDNDSLANPALHDAVIENADKEGCKFAFVKVPDVNRLRELANIVNSGTTSLLLIIKRESMKTGALRKMLKGMYPDNVYIILV